MVPLRVTATVAGHVSLPWGYVHLDGILAAEIAARRGLPPPHIGGLVEIELPLERHATGFWMASASESQIEESIVLFRQRRFPFAEALARGDARLRRIDTTVGRQKNTRIPVEACYLKDSLMVFYALGDLDQVREILSTVRAVGSQRGSGKGEVSQWTVEPCDEWDGFPVLRDGRPLRHLPGDHQGVTDGEKRIGRLSPPYWWPENRVEIWCPLVGAQSTDGH